MVASLVFRLQHATIYSVRLRTLRRRVRVGYSIQMLDFGICTPSLALLGCSVRAWRGVEREVGGDCELEVWNQAMWKRSVVDLLLSMLCRARGLAGGGYMPIQATRLM